MSNNGVFVGCLNFINLGTEVFINNEIDVKVANFLLSLYIRSNYECIKHDLRIIVTLIGVFKTLTSNLSISSFVKKYKVIFTLLTLLVMSLKNSYDAEKDVFLMNRMENLNSKTYLNFCLSLLNIYSRIYSSDSEFFDLNSKIASSLFVIKDLLCLCILYMLVNMNLSVVEVLLSVRNEKFNQDSFLNHSKELLKKRNLKFDLLCDENLKMPIDLEITLMFSENYEILRSSHSSLMSKNNDKKIGDINIERPLKDKEDEIIKKNKISGIMKEQDSEVVINKENCETGMNARSMKDDNNDADNDGPVEQPWDVPDVYEINGGMLGMKRYVMFNIIKTGRIKEDETRMV
jgi:hypothetical protein